MKSKLVLAVISLFLALSMVIAACSNQTTTSTNATITTSTAPSAIATTTAPSTITTTNWWDNFGEPEYGGTITLPFTGLAGPAWDVNTIIGGDFQFYREAMFSLVDWTLDRNKWNYTTMFTPEPYMVGHLVESWEQPDLQTVIYHLRKGVYWQNKPPVNGREFVANDVVEHYDRILGTGSGYTEPNPFYKGGLTPNWGKFIALDNYTVKFNFTQPMGAIGFATLMADQTLNAIEAPEWVRQGDLQNWRNAVGTGPWILTDWVENVTLTYSKNPDYWGHDERHPKNQLPYADTFKTVWINDPATRSAAFRTGQIDLLTNLSRDQLSPLQSTTPDLNYIYVPGMASSVVMRVDKKPFDDINVRKALQLSLDLDAIAKKLNTKPIPCGLMSPKLTGLNYPYEDWPQSLKDEYGYNPTQAKKLLADAGYPNGFATNMILPSNTSPEIFEAIKAFFAEIGVNMEIRQMDFVASRTFIGSGKHDQCVAGGLAMSQNIVACLSRFYSKMTDVNNGFVNDPTFDSLYDEVNKAVSFDEAAKIVAKADQRVIEQHWHVVTIPNDTLCVWRPYLKGYSGEQTFRWYSGAWVMARLWVNK